MRRASIAAGQRRLRQTEFRQDLCDADKASALIRRPTALALVGWVIFCISTIPTISKSTPAARQSGALRKACAGGPDRRCPSRPRSPTPIRRGQGRRGIQAHSGLGLAYFRRQNWEGSITELTKATATATPPDPTDYYVMGVPGNLTAAEAADAYGMRSFPGACKARI